MTATAAFLGTGADSPWVHALYEALAGFEDCRVVATRFTGLGTAPIPPSSNAVARLTERPVRVPPAFATSLHFLTRGYLSNVFAREFSALADSTGSTPFMIVTNPSIERWTRTIPDSQLIYWNFDDYFLYQPQRAHQIEEWEDRLISRARLVLCASRTLQERCANRFPQHAHRIHHFPNAVRAEWIATPPYVAAEKDVVGFVGNLEDRVDWRFVKQVALACPTLKFVFVGSLEPTGSSGQSDWLAARNAAAALPNVEMPGPVPQADVWKWYRSFDIGWMPYDAAHSFNVASSPTKIFDALGAGRPFVSTAVPECLLYPGFISILRSPEDAPGAFATCKAQWNDDRLAEQIAFAHENDWAARARWLRGTLASDPQGPAS